MVSRRWLVQVRLYMMSLNPPETFDTLILSVTTTAEMRDFDTAGPVDMRCYESVRIVSALHQGFLLAP